MRRTFEYFISSRKRIILFLLLLFALLFIIYVAVPFHSPYFDTDYSTVVKSEDGVVLRVFLNDDDQWCFPPEDTANIPDKLKKAVLYFEDEYFYYHPGVNPGSVFRAVRQNIEAKKVVSGASTVTMQVCRIRNPKERNFINKIAELFEALKLDIRNSKEEILKMYLDHAPYGGNIQGYKAAALRYFGKDAVELSWAEAATLAVLPNAPGLYSPGRSDSLLLNKRNFLLKKLYTKGEIDSVTYILSLSEELPATEYRFDMKAPHLCRFLHKQYPNDKLITTTINAHVQELAADEVRHYSSSLRSKGIYNVAALIIDNEEGAVKAYVGSQDFFDSYHNGQVNGVLASRSSGSVLKPFLYALSIDDGIILPQTLMKDVPSYFDAFSPSNADEKFSGVVRAKDALTRSLNVPAVRLLNTYGVYKFYSFLKSAGVSTLFRSADEYGLPLIIGGAEVKLWDVAQMYRSLANNGIFEEIYVCDKDTLPERKVSTQLISSGATYQVLEILKELKRPGIEYYWQRFNNRRPIAWKTGTSYGQKDAWAVGVTPQWTVAVWVGNFDGEGNPELSGAVSAGPLLFELFNNLEYNPAKKWFDKVEMDFISVRICHETGFIANENCPHADTVDMPAFAKPVKVCPYHKAFYIDTVNSYSVCSYCRNEKQTKKKVFCVYPTEVIEQLRKRGHTVETVPMHNPLCTHKTDISPLKILYPNDSAHVYIPTDFNNSKQRIVSHVSHADKNSTVFWYIDNIYSGETKNKHKQALLLDAGRHTLYVSDNNSYEDSVVFYVKREE